MADDQNFQETEKIREENQEQEKEDRRQNIRLNDIRKILERERSDFFRPPKTGSSFPKFSNAGRLGSRTAAQTGRAAAQAGRMAAQLGARAAAAAAPAVAGFFLSPPGWIVLGVVAVVIIITFLIVYLTGKDIGSSQINLQEVNAGLMQISPITSATSTPSATLSPTPTPPAAL